MPVSNIFAEFARPVRSIDDYANDLNQQALQRQALELGQINLLKERQGVEQGNKLMATTAAFGDDQGQNYNALVRSGNLTAAQKYQQANLEAQKTREETERAKAQAADHQAKAQETHWGNQSKKLELATRRLAALDPHDDEALVNAYELNVKDGLYGDDRQQAVDKAVASIEAMPPKGTPERTRWFATQLLQGLNYKDQVDAADKAQQRGEAARHNQSTEATAQGTLGVAQERVGIERQRERRIASASVGSPSSPSSANTLDDDDVKFMAQQYLRGDQSVMTNVGRGAQGAENIVRIRKAIRQQAEAQGLDPAQVAMRVAQFQGDKAAYRTAGTKGANIEMAATEAGEVAELALESSKKFDRTSFMPVNKAIRAYQTNTGDPSVAEFGAANLALINTYARAISPSGVPTVNDKQHAEQMLNTAQSQTQYEAVVGQMKKEIAAARRSPGMVRENMGARMSGKPASESKVVNFSDLKN